jgi:hypothetical protein
MYTYTYIYYFYYDDEIKEDEMGGGVQHAWKT